MPDDPETSVRMAIEIAALLGNAGLEKPGGCATLALAYAVWIEEHPTAHVGMVSTMIECGKLHAERAFVVLRELRAAKAQITAEALGLREC
jgi:hypothetical protein